MHFCRNTKKTQETTLDLLWDENIDDSFNACIKVEVENVRGVLALISSQIAQNDCNIESVTYDDTKETGHNIMVFIVSVIDIKTLTKFPSILTISILNFRKTCTNSLWIKIRKLNKNKH